MDETDKILKQRYVPQTPSNLAHRIVAAAMPSAAPSLQRSVWEEVMEMFIVPRPAMVLGLTLLIGLLFGFEAGGMVDFSQEDWSSFLRIDEGDLL